jgi:hypothetical protein
MENIELLILNEQLVGSLYSIYAEKFPEEKDFWLKIASEESTHAELLEKVEIAMQEAPSLFKAGRFNIPDIELSISFVKDLIKKSENFTLLNALFMARDIENSIIEKYFFKVIADDSYFIQSTFARIEQETKKHRDKIQELLNKYNSQ